MTTEFTLRVGIDGSPAKRGAQDVTRSLEDIKQKAGQAERSVGGMDNANKSAAKGFDDLKRMAVGGASALDRVGMAALGAAAAYASLSTARDAMLTVIRTSSAFEQAGMKTTAVLKATGHSAGQTAESIRDMAREIAYATLASTQGVEAAAQKLLTFRSVAGDTFRRTLELAQDLAAVGFGSIESASVQLGKALENPTQGISTLTEVGVSFSAAQRDLIKNLQESGRLLEAQGIILDAVAVQVGGAGAGEAGGLTGKVDSLSQRWEELIETVGHGTGALEKSGVLLDLIREDVEAITRLFDQSAQGQLARIEKEIAGLQAMRDNAWTDRGRDEAQKRIDALEQQRNLLAANVAIEAERVRVEKTAANEAMRLAQLQADAERKTAQEAAAATKAAEQAMKDAERLAALREAQEARWQDTLGDTIRDMETHNEVLRLQIAGQTEAAAWLETEARLREQLGPLYDQNADKVKQLWTEQQQLNERLKDQKTAAEKAAQAHERATDKAIKEYQQFNDEVRRVSENIANDVSRDCEEFPDDVINTEHSNAIIAEALA